MKQSLLDMSKCPHANLSLPTSDTSPHTSHGSMNRRPILRVGSHSVTSPKFHSYQQVSYQYGDKIPTYKYQDIKIWVIFIKVGSWLLNT